MTSLIDSIVQQAKRSRRPKLVDTDFCPEKEFRTWCRKSGMKRGVNSSAYGSRIIKDRRVHIVIGYSGKYDSPIRTRQLYTNAIVDFPVSSVHPKHRNKL